MRRILVAIALLLAACGPASDRVHVDTTTTQRRPATPDTWVPLPNDPPGIDDEVPLLPEELPPATVDGASPTVAGVEADAFDAAMNVVVQAYNWPAVLPGWRIERREPRSGLLGLTFVLERRIEIYPRLGEDLQHQAYVIAHELGHAVDLERVSPFERAIWASNRGYGLFGWFPAEGVSDFESGAGDFAESFAYTLVPCAHCWSSELGDPPTTAEQGLMGALIR